MSRVAAFLMFLAFSNVLPAQEASWPPSQSMLDVNNMTTMLRSDGFFPWRNAFVANDPTLLNATFPKGSGLGGVFTQGLVWGGLVRDGSAPLVRVNGNTYVSGLDPGRVLRDPTTGAVAGPDTRDRPEYHVWRVRRDWATTDLSASAAAFFEKEIENVTDTDVEAIRAQYQQDWRNWPAEWGAPFEDVDRDDDYNPDIDIPGHPGADQTMWIVANDLRDGTPQQSYGSPPIGVEYQLTLWAYDAPADEALGNIHYARHRLIYTGTEETPAGARIDSMFLLLFVDTDLGRFSDDFLGYDTTRALAYTYNANTDDEVYAARNLPPPAFGWDMIRGPVTSEGDTLAAHTFFRKASGQSIGDPNQGIYSGTLQFYNFMRGLRPRPEYPAGDPIINWLTGHPTHFTVTGDPIRGTGWIDGMDLPPGDRRFWMSTGPFSLSVGDTVDVVFAQIAAHGSSNLSSLSLLRLYDSAAQFAFDLDEENAGETTAHPAPELPESIELDIYPNPFHARTTVILELDRPQYVHLALYDLLGRRVALLYDGPMAQRSAHSLTVDAHGLGNGIYLLRAATESAIETRRVVLLKQ